MRAAQQLVRLLVDAGGSLAVAESLTGGAVSDALVEVPGASRCLRGAVVAYATDLKATMLDVAPELLATHGAVHPAVAAAMARGVRDRLGADYGIGTTGVAGPEPQDGCRPGTFHVAVCGPDGVVQVRSQEADVGAQPPGREAVRRAARDAALDLAVHVVRGTAAPRG